MSFEILSERLSALQDSNAQLEDLIERLATINFQPGSVPLGDEEGGVVQELSTEIQQTIKDQDEYFEVLLEEVADLGGGRQDSEQAQRQGEMEHAVKKAIRELKTCESSFRKAQMKAKRNLEAAQRAERELLLQSYIEPQSGSGTSSPGPGAIPPRRRTQRSLELSQEEKTVNASSDVTLALRRSHDLMAAELSRSQFAHETLKESTAALAQLSETYSTLDTLLSSSKNLLGTLLRSQKSDTWYLETAFYVLCVTIGWLVFRRLLYGPTWWLFWLPMKMFFKGWMGVFSAMGLRGGTTASAGVMSPSVSSMNSVVAQSSATTSAVHRSGTRAPGSIPSRPPNGGRQNINVGGGGRGAPMPHDRYRATRPDSVSETEKVGKIIDESREEVGEVVESHVEEQVNPKKRMWEEEKEAEKEAERTRDEL